MTATANEPAARHSKRRHRSPRGPLLAFLVLALGAAGAGFVVRAQAERPPAAAGSGPVLAPAAYVLSAEATAQVRAARFLISTTRPPASALLTLDPAGAAPTRNVRVDLAAGSAEVVVRALAAGRATWAVSAEGAPTVRGTLRIPATRHEPASPPGLGAAPLLPGLARPSSAAEVSSPDTDRSGRPGPSGATPSTAAPVPTPPGTPRPTPTPTPRPTGAASPDDPTPTAAPLATPTLRVSTGTSRILAGTRTRPQVAISGLPAGYRQTATLRLYGPATEQAGITCRSSTLFHTQSVLVTGNGTYVGTDVRLDKAGYYGWSVELPGSATSSPAWSGCAPAGAVVQVTQW